MSHIDKKVHRRTKRSREINLTKAKAVSNQTLATQFISTIVHITETQSTLLLLLIPIVDIAPEQVACVSKDEYKMSSEETKIVCENCDKKNQKALPEDSIASPGYTCAEAYRAVSACMEANKGQVSSCSRQWEIFRTCHDNSR